MLKKVDSVRLCRSVANELGVEKNQIQGIVRDREDILKRWGSCERSDKKYTKVRKIRYKRVG